MTIASNPQECQYGRFSVNDAYNSMRMNGHFRSEIGEQYLKSSGCSNVNLWTQSKGEVQKVDRLQELANLYREEYPNLVNDDGLAMGLATAEVAGQVKRTENGIMIIACNGIQYMDNNDQSKGWGFMFSENDTDIYNEIMKAIKEGSIKGGMESVSGWEAWFQGKGYIYERIFSDEELAVMANGKDVKHDADFIAGSDRGKVLAVTMNADSMRSTISVEVFDPVYK